MESCRIEQRMSYPDYFKELDWTKTLKDAEALLSVVLDFKAYHNLDQVILPFQDEPFYRAIGLDLNYDWDLGIQVASTDSTCFNNNWDWSVIEPYQEIIQHLSDKKIPVTLQVSGLFSSISNWIPLEELILMTRKDSQNYEALMSQMSEKIIAWMQIMAQAGISEFYYADAVGGVDIVGPRFYGKYLGPWTYRLLSQRKEIKPMLLCPRSFFSMQILNLFEENPLGMYHRSLCSADNLHRPRIGAYQLKERSVSHD